MNRSTRKPLPAGLLSILFSASVVATLAHFVDNIIYLPMYPDPHWLTVTHLVVGWLVLMPIGVAGYLWYRAGKYPRAFYALYVYSIASMFSLGHYAHMPLSEISFKINLLILLEAGTAVVLGLFVAYTHYRMKTT